MTFGEKLAELRRAKNLKQDDIAEALGVTPQAVSKWENDASCPDIMSLPALADILGVTVNDLFEQEEIPQTRYLPPDKRKSFDEMVLRILVDEDGDHVKINLPLPLIKVALEAGLTGAIKGNVGNFDLSKIDFNYAALRFSPRSAP